LGLESGQVFSILHVAYEKGVTRKFMPILGNVLRSLMRNTGKGIDELLGYMDTAQDGTIRSIDRLLQKSGWVLKIATSERLMGLVARLLDFKLAVWATERLLLFFLQRTIEKSEGRYVTLPRRLRQIRLAGGG
jgi:hypothetical protein